MKKQIVMLLCIIIILQACSSGPAKEASTGNGPASTVTLTSVQQKNADIQLGLLTDHKVEEVLKLSGLVDVPPQNLVSVSFPLGGYLKSTRLLPGMHVRKGESLALVEDQGLVQLQQDYLVAKARLTQTRLEYERQRSLNESKTAADKVLQLAQAEYESTRIQVLGLAEKLRLIHINPDRLSGNTISRMVSIPSPISGYVSKVNMNIGRYIQPQDVLFELINPEDIHAALTVFEKDLGRVHEGQKVTISFVDDPESQYMAEVILVTRNVDENRSGTIHCHFEKIPPALKPGMFINATLTIGSATTKSLPEEAVVRFANKEYVFVQREKDVFEAIPVKTGKRNDGWVEIPGDPGFSPGQPVVVKNAFAVLSAMKNVAEE